MPDFVPDDEARDRRLAAIRARRGTPERLAEIEAMMAAKERAKKPKAAAGGGSGRKTPENSTEFFGHPWAFWFEMRDAGYEHIIERAREKQTTTYADLWAAVSATLGQDLGNPWRQVDHLLVYIGKAAHEKDGVMPTALVMYEQADDPNPGPGFFRLAADLGLFPEADVPPTGAERTPMNDAQRSFWEDQRDKVFAHFAS